MRGQTKINSIKKNKIERVTKTIELLNNSFNKKTEENKEPV